MMNNTVVDEFEAIAKRSCFGIGPEVVLRTPTGLLRLVADDDEYVGIPNPIVNGRRYKVTIAEVKGSGNEGIAKT